MPNGRNAIEGETFTPDKTVFRTVVYRQYTKDFAKPIANGAGNEGIQGPLLRARVGDTLLVHFRNLDTLTNQPHSMHFHGVRYRFGSDGAYIPGFSGPGANVKPGETFTYRLVAERELRRRLAVPRPLAVDDRVDRGRDVRRALDPRAGRAARPTASSSSTSRRTSGS